LLTDAERETMYYKFNERALMRGTLKDQADYFAKALGAGGHQPWHTANEVRDLAEYPADQNAKFSTLGEPSSARKAGNEPQTTT
ncbi:phage portal protein, partial [Klebsiella pneumoniae]|nr:phage portal protein [Klebsiella pneumoniae]